MRKTLSNSNSNTCRAFITRSTNRGRVFDSVSGCLRPRHNTAGLRLRWNLEHSVVCLCIRVISSGYRGFASVLQNSPSRVSDVLQILSPVFVTSQALHVLKRIEGFSAWGAKNFSHSNINCLRSAKS